MDEELFQRFASLSVPELRRRVALALGYLCELRMALAVQAGMTLELARGPIPELQGEHVQAIFEEIAQLLPLRSVPLATEERRRFRRITAEERAQLEAAIEVLEHDPAAFMAAAAELGLDTDPGLLEGFRDLFTKVDLVDEVREAIADFHADVLRYQEDLVTRLGARAVSV